MSSRERVLVAVVACLTLVVVPMTALAATGQLVNITDGTNAARLARVNDAGALLVQSYPGTGQNISNLRASKSTTGWLSLVDVPSGKPFAIVEATLGAVGASAPSRVHLRRWTVDAAVTCANAPTGAGASYQDQRYLIVPNETTIQLDFPASLQVAAAPGGKHTCIGFHIFTLPAGTTLFLGMTGYVITP